MEHLPIPEDHAAPHTPVTALAKGHLEAGDPDGAVVAHCLGSGLFLWSFREEEIVPAASDTSPFA